MKIFLINGPYGAGKDTFGEFLFNQFYQISRHRIIHINFADWVKDVCRRYFNWDGNKQSEAGRSLLQYIATDVVRYKLPNYWGDTVSNLLYSLQDEFDVAIITDFRFPNEYDCLLKRFSPADIITIHIDRQMPDRETRHHISENSLNDFVFDCYIDNNGTLEDLEAAAKQIGEIYAA